MKSLECYRADAERIVKRMKKTELVDYIARMQQRYDKELENTQGNAVDAREERDRLRREVSTLERVRDVVAMLVERDAKLKEKLNPAQLTMALQMDSEDLGNNAVESSLFKLMENVDKFIDEFGGDSNAPSYYVLQEALYCAQEDRAALLRLLGLNDRAWALQGGHSFTDVEV